MSYQALYRVWRPRKFSDLVGQSHITQTLKNALKSEKYSHAYLFSGPRGTGKTSAAKIFAQTINCEKMPTDEPCNECDACRGILDGSISDVIEMDAASNTGVDDIRDIRETVKYAPSAVPYKVYIIDEVHMISTSAFNALLKTLEEPPKHVVFILATTEPHKIPLTVISRCQRFDFKSINNKVIANRLSDIMTHEDLEITSDALEAVALHAEGGMRDALSILDQAISYTDGKIEIDDILAVTGGVSQEILTEVTEAMFDQDTKETLRLFDELVRNGKDPGRFVFDYIYFLRDMLFYKTNKDLAAYMERAIVTEVFEQLANRIDTDWIQNAMMEFTSCEQQIKWTNSPKVFVEVALIAIASQQRTEAAPDIQGLEQAPITNTADDEQVQQLMSRIDALEQSLSKLSNAQAGQGTAGSSPAPKRQPQRSKGKAYKIPYDRIRTVLDNAKKQALQNAHNNWTRFLEELKSANAQAHATIQNSTPAAGSEDTLVVSFKYEIHCKLFLEHQEMAASVLEGVLGERVTIIPIPEADWLILRNEYVQGRNESEQTEESSSDPVVDEAKKLFGEDGVEVHE